MVLSTLCLLLGQLAFAQTLTQGERDRAMSELHATRKLLIDALAGLNEKQLEFKDTPESWSVAEIAEHLALTEDLLFSSYQKVAAQTADPAKTSAVKDEQVLALMKNREEKRRAPGALIPKRTFPSAQAALAEFKQRRDRTIRFVETTKDEGLRHKLLEGFNCDGYQIFLMMAGHTERHVMQINEVKGGAKFPR
ncbi:MAG: DinB family protein [Bryobacter sp.]|nr:DinB family protein [Bryobacter sp.]